MGRIVYYDSRGNEIDPPKAEPDKMTNSDRVRSMTDEQLAEKLVGFDCSYPSCPCRLRICSEEGCFEAWLDWMKEEAKA